MRVMVLFSIHPIGEGVHVGAHVARAVAVIRASGLEHQLGPSGTTIVGAWDEVFACIKACHAELARDTERVSSLIKVDQWEALGPGSIAAKVARVEARTEPATRRARRKLARRPRRRGREG